MIEKFVDLYEKKTRFIVFDVETVGENIVEIGAIEAGTAYSKDYRTFHKILRFKPSSWKPYWRELKIHQIPAQLIENGEDPAQVLSQFLDFIKDTTLICHSTFDIRAVRKNLLQHAELKFAADLPIWEKAIDSLKLARKICIGLESYSLTNLADHFSIENPQAHRALADAHTTKRIVGKLLGQYYWNKRCQNKRTP